MGIEGHLNITLKTGDGAVNAVTIESTRPVHASMVFHGKSIAESQKMIPLLFSICGTAQSCAGVRACEQALGVKVAAQTEQLRDDLVDMETLREHMWRILLDWPAFAGGEADRKGMAEMVAIQRDYRQALCTGGSVFELAGGDCHADIEALKGVLERFAALLEKKAFAMPATDWLNIAGQQPLADWSASGKTIAAELIDRIIQAGWSSAGACESEALPSLSEPQLHQAMQDVDYVKRPLWSGCCCETSSLTRVDSPLLKALKQEYGNGLLVRLVARLTEIARLADQMFPGAADVVDDHRDSQSRPTNQGIGQAAAARGQLVHRVELNGDVIGKYQILAPTEWNFHPNGVVVRALSTLKGDPDQLEMQARLLINAIDPCVGYALSIEH